jgi:hypothetical protein
MTCCHMLFGWLCSASEHFLSNNTLKLFLSSNENTCEAQNKKFSLYFLEVEFFLSVRHVEWLLFTFLVPPNETFSILKV